MHCSAARVIQRKMAVGEGDSRARIQRKALLGEEDASLVFETSKEVDVIPTFDQMNIREELLRGIYAYGKGRGGMHC